MSILVDELRPWPTKIRCFKQGAAHLTFVAPSTVDDLHQFALSIGLRREWFQGARVEHYDLTAKKREAAVQFLEYLSSDTAQRYFADGNNEWPVVDSVKVNNPALEAMGKFKADSLPVATLAKNAVAAQRIYDLDFVPI